MLSLFCKVHLCTDKLDLSCCLSFDFMSSWLCEVHLCNDKLDLSCCLNFDFMSSCSVKYICVLISWI